MRFVLFALGDEAWWSSLPKAEMGQRVAGFGSYQAALKEAGVFVGAYRPEPSHAAKTVRLADGKSVVRDGPPTTSKEQLGGIYIVEGARSRHTALSWAARNPAASDGVVEVRPLVTPPATA
jgi:hypothetical protein